MSTLKFADTHNMVVFLSKPAESEGFEQIVDFLNANPIKFALTINPTIYTSCIEQFWAIVKAKTVNREVQLQALVDGKKVIITESTVRRDLHLKDAEGVGCLPNATIFEQLTLMRLLIGSLKPSSHVAGRKAQGDVDFTLKALTQQKQVTSKDCQLGNPSLENKTLVPEPDSSPCCAKCGTPVDGPYCRGCALLRKEFEEDLLPYCVENVIFQDSQDTFESSDDNTNVINALQEPIVVNQDPGVKSSQGPPLINQNCCYECGDSLDGIFCQKCIFKFCGKGAHYGYNCPPKDPEQCNQTINELPQTLPSVRPTCNSGDKNSFTYDSKPHSFNDSPSILTHPPQLQFETYLCELCGNNAHYGYDCSPQFPFVYEQEPCYNQNFNDNYFLQNSQSSSQQYFPVNYPPQETSREILQAQEDLMEAIQAFLKEIRESKDALTNKQYRQEDIQELMSKLLEDVRNTSEEFSEYINCLSWNRPLFYFDDDDDEYTVIWRRPKAITPDEPIKEPDNSLIMEDEHLDTILETESDEFIKSSVENLVQNPSESADVSDGESECDVPIDDDSPESHFTTFSNPLFDSNDDFSSDDESLSEEEIQKDEFKYFSNPLYDLDDEIITNEKILPNQKDLDVVIPIPPGIDERCFNAESDLLESLLNRDSPIESTKIDSIFDEFSLPRPPEESNSEYSNATNESLSPSPIPVEDSDPFMEEIDIFLASDDSIPPGVESDYDSEGDILLLEELLNDDLVPLAEYNHFTFDIEPDTAVKNDFDELNEDECFDPGGGENVVFLNVEEDDSFTFTIRTFLPFVTYPEVSPLLSSTKNEDTIFDPGIFT
ncbi:hypothetical protein Tco_0243498 [Tanacetum coccineum]